MGESTSGLQGTHIMKAVLLLAGCATLVFGATVPSYSVPSYPTEAPKYSYSYSVQDDYSKVNFGANEDRDGYSTSGAYYVALPDGRLQKVTYSVNGEGGYVAEVSYEGEASYPEVKPYVPPPASAYKTSS